MFNRLIHILRKYDDSRLYRATFNDLKKLKEGGYSAGRLIYCNFSGSSRSKFSFSSSIITNDPYRGDVCGIYHFYHSIKFATLTDALSFLTRQAVVMEERMPDFTVSRTVSFATCDDVDAYYQGFIDDEERTDFIESKAGHDTAGNLYGVLDKFEEGEWVATYANETEERLNLIENEVETYHVR